MERSTRGPRSLSSIWIVLGVAVLGVAGLALVLASPGAGPAAPATVAMTATPPVKPPTRTPAPRPEVPDVAPNFTLHRAGGGSFTLADHLEEGPVVLVFFQRCG